MTEANTPIRMISDAELEAGERVLARLEHWITLTRIGKGGVAQLRRELATERAAARDKIDAARAYRAKLEQAAAEVAA